MLSWANHCAVRGILYIKKLYTSNLGGQTNSASCQLALYYPVDDILL